MCTLCLQECSYYILKVIEYGTSGMLIFLVELWNLDSKILNHSGFVLINGKRGDTVKDFLILLHIVLPNL